VHGSKTVPPRADVLNPHDAPPKPRAAPARSIKETKRLKPARSRGEAAASTPKPQSALEPSTKETVRLEPARSRGEATAEHPP
jgi:hypothetical protein